MSNYSRDRYYDQNRNARIVTRTDRTGKLRTETQRRDPDSTLMAISTDQRDDSTNLFIDFADESVRLTGREARSLYRLLRKHYGKAGKSRTA
jgi:hypothetical protein